MGCVRTVSFSVMINGKDSEAFVPLCGLRQGDPLYPYLFLLCSEGLSALLDDARSKGVIQGLKVARDAPDISHLFFADDSLLFCKETP